MNREGGERGVQKNRMKNIKGRFFLEETGGGAGGLYIYIYFPAEEDIITQLWMDDGLMCVYEFFHRHSLHSLGFSQFDLFFCHCLFVS